MTTVTDTTAPAPTSNDDQRAALLALISEWDLLEALADPGCPAVPVRAVAATHLGICETCPDGPLVDHDPADAVAVVCRRNDAHDFTHRYEVCAGCVRVALHGQITLHRPLAIWVEVPVAAARPPAPVIPIARGAR